jgi:hypothetical protein
MLLLSYISKCYDYSITIKYTTCIYCFDVFLFPYQAHGPWYGTFYDKTALALSSQNRYRIRFKVYYTNGIFVTIVRTLSGMSSAMSDFFRTACPLGRPKRFSSDITSVRELRKGSCRTISMLQQYPTYRSAVFPKALSLLVLGCKIMSSLCPD